jgi:hypothetical protein
VQNFLAKNQIQTITQPPHSPDLTPCDFWLFPRLQMGLKGHRFAPLEENQQKATAGLRVTAEENFRGASSNGGIAGASLYVQIGSTSRVTSFAFLHILFTKSYA